MPPVDWYDRWKTNPPEEKIWGECDHCGREIYEGDEVIEVTEGRYVHADCFDDFARDELIVRRFNAGD